MNTSATPAVAFTAVVHNPLNKNVNASLLFNLPLGMEPNTQRVESQMASPIIQSSPSSSLGQHQASSHLDCFSDCKTLNSCLSWSYDPTNQMCAIFEDVRLNGHKDGSYSGIKVAKYTTCTAYHLHNKIIELWLSTKFDSLLLPPSLHPFLPLLLPSLPPPPSFLSREHGQLLTTASL